MKKLIFPLLFLIIFKTGQSQHLGAYTDYRDRFYIFDHGESTKVEDLMVQSFDIGGECVMYINSQGHLKIYNDGKLTKLESGGVSKYFATDHLAAYSIFEKLKVVEDGQAITLSTRCPIYSVEDSLIVFYDKNLESLRVYYEGESKDIESGMVGMPVDNFSSGDNMVAYISSRTKDFKIYYKGKNHTILQYVEGLSFKAGKDIVAYKSNIDNTFHVYYKGENYQLEDFPPKSYKVGDGFVAYVDEMGVFKVFYNGKVQEVSSFSPETYIAEDYLLIFTEHEYFKVFSKGSVHEVEAYIPKSFKLDWNTVAYLDNSNRIWLVVNGEKKYLINDLINTFDIYRDLIIMNVKVNRNIVYYQDEFFEGLSF
ncbi:hypothetical protein ES705_22007 [subsurface metagenome]